VFVFDKLLIGFGVICITLEAGVFVCMRSFDLARLLESGA